MTARTTRRVFAYLVTAALFLPLVLSVGVGMARADDLCGGGDGLPQLSRSETQQWLDKMRAGESNEDSLDAGSPEKSAAVERAVRDMILSDCTRNWNVVGATGSARPVQSDLTGGEKLTAQLRDWLAPFLLLGLSVAAVYFIFRRDMVRFVQFAAIAVGVAVLFYNPWVIPRLAETLMG